MIASQLLTADISRTNPKDLAERVVSVIESTTLSLDGLLLNPGDEIAISALVTRFDDLAVRGRIAGVRAINKKKEPIPMSSKRLLDYRGIKPGGFRKITAASPGVCRTLFEPTLS